MFYVLTADDVGKPFLRCLGNTWAVSGFMGRILPGDVGKRVYRVLPQNILQVENDEQRAARLARLARVDGAGR